MELNDVKTQVNIYSNDIYNIKRNSQYDEKFWDTFFGDGELYIKYIKTNLSEVNTVMKLQELISFYNELTINYFNVITFLFFYPILFMCKLLSLNLLK
jgi:hypothetical protein